MYLQDYMSVGKVIFMPSGFLRDYLLSEVIVITIDSGVQVPP